MSLRLTGQTAACNDINPNERLLVSIFLPRTRDDGIIFLQRYAKLNVERAEIRQIDEDQSFAQITTTLRDVETDRKSKCDEI